MGSRESHVTHSSPGAQLLATARSIRILIVAYACDVGFSTLTTGAFLVGYARWLWPENPNLNRQLGLLTAVPAAIQVLRLVTTYLAERVENRKLYGLICWTLGYIFVWIPIILLPAWLAPPWRLWGLIGGLSAGAFFFILPGSIYLAWLSELVPEDIRGRFWGRRNAIGGLCGMVLVLSGGRFIDRFEQEGGFGWLFGVALLLGLGFLICVSLLPPPKARAKQPPRFAEVFRIPLRNPAFRQLLIFLVFLDSSLTLAGPFYSLYLLEHLGLSYSRIALCSSLYTAFNLITTPFWGYLLDRHGHAPVLRLTGFGMTWVLLLWIFATREQPAPIFVAYGLSGLIFSGLTLAPMNLTLKLAPEEHRQLYSSLFLGFSALTGSIAPLVGAQIMDAAQGWEASVGPLRLVNFHLLFLIACTLRLVASLLLPLPAEEGAMGGLQLAQQLAFRHPLSTFFNLQRFLAGRSPRTRQQASRRLGQLGSALAVGELIQGLEDPSLDVRQEAARALGEIRAEQAVPELLRHLHEDHEDLLPEVIEALGKIGDDRAVPRLLELLQDRRQDRAIRRQAALALGEFDRPDVRQVLLEQLGSDEPPRFLAVVADSLGKLREWRALERIFARLEAEPTPSVRAQLANALARLLGDEAFLYALLKASPMDREVAVDRLLRGLRRRVRRREELAELAPMVEEVLAAYGREDRAAAGRTLARIGERLAARRPDHFDAPQSAARWTLLQLVAQAAQARDLWPEEVLLAMVAVREMLVRLEGRLEKARDGGHKEP